MYWTWMGPACPSSGALLLVLAAVEETVDDALDSAPPRPVEVAALSAFPATPEGLPLFLLLLAFALLAFGFAGDVDEAGMS